MRRGGLIVYLLLHSLEYVICSTVFVGQQRREVKWDAADRYVWNAGMEIESALLSSLYLTPPRFFASQKCDCARITKPPYTHLNGNPLMNTFW